MKQSAASPPLYRQLAAALRVRISAGHYPVGKSIPTEKDLAEAYNVSRSTVRAAIRSLTSEGLLKARPGIGTTVIRAHSPVRTATMRGLTEDLREQGVSTNARTLSVSFIDATPALREKLQLGADERVLHLYRLREIVGSPFGLISSYIPESVGLTPKDDFSGPLYELIENTRRLHITYCEDSVGARAPTEEEQRLLQVPETTPILSISRTAFVEFDRPVELVEALIRSDLYKYDVTLSR